MTTDWDYGFRVLRHSRRKASASFSARNGGRRPPTGPRNDDRETSHPRRLGRMPAFVGRDGVALREREIELVEAFEQAPLAIGVDVEAIRLAVGADDPLCRKIDLHMGAGLGFQRTDQ